MGSDGFWWLLMGSDGLWWGFDGVLMGSDGFWWGFDGVLWGFMGFDGWKFPFLWIFRWKKCFHVKMNVYNVGNGWADYWSETPPETVRTRTFFQSDHASEKKHWEPGSLQPNKAIGKGFTVELRIIVSAESRQSSHNKSMQWLNPNSESAMLINGVGWYLCEKLRGGEIRRGLPTFESKFGNVSCCLAVWLFHKEKFWKMRS